MRDWRRRYSEIPPEGGDHDYPEWDLPTTNVIIQLSWELVSGLYIEAIRTLAVDLILEVRITQRRHAATYRPFSA